MEGMVLLTFSHVHHLFDQRPLLSISYLLNKIYDYKKFKYSEEIFFSHLKQIILGNESFEIDIKPRGWNGNVGSSQVNRMLSGVYYIGSQISEVHPRHILEGEKCSVSQSIF